MLRSKKFLAEAHQRTGIRIAAYCLTTPETTQTKQVTIFIGRSDEKNDTPIERMKRKLDTLYGRFVYNKRIAIVEPVFRNLRNKGMDRFTLRARTK